jgi:hypothetical protein
VHCAWACKPPSQCGQGCSWLHLHLLLLQLLRLQLRLLLLLVV